MYLGHVAVNLMYVCLRERGTKFVPPTREAVVASAAAASPSHPSTAAPHLLLACFIRPDTRSPSVPDGLLGRAVVHAVNPKTPLTELKRPRYLNSPRVDDCARRGCPSSRSVSGFFLLFYFPCSSSVILRISWFPFLSFWFSTHRPTRSFPSRRGPVMLTDDGGWRQTGR